MSEGTGETTTTDAEADSPTTILGVELPVASESETARDGVLSSDAEMHALAVGLLVGITGHLDLLLLLVTFVMGRFDGFRRSGHLLDAVREPAYVFAGSALGLAAHILLWGDAAFGGFIA
jgi:hypothetical protein